MADNGTSRRSLKSFHFVQRTMSEFKTGIEAMQRDPALYFEKVLGVTTLESYQRRLLKEIAFYDRVAVKACHDVGKTWTLARTVLWFMSCFENSKVITTAPTYNQVKNILWSEINSAHAKSVVPLGGAINMTEWRLSPEWFALGFTSRNEAGGNADGQGTLSTFQGFHAPHLLVVFDEATGIPPAIWKMAEGLLTSHNVKFVAIGNPTSKQSSFFKCFTSARWRKISLNCFDSPNLIANGITTLELLKAEVEKYKAMPASEAMDYVQTYKVVRPHLLTTKWVVESIAEWGFSHPLTQGKVLGDFPDDDEALFSMGTLGEAMLSFPEFLSTERKTIGVDVARFGSDATCMTALHGKQFKGKKKLQKKDTGEVVGEVVAFYREHGADVIVVDETGLGGGVVDGLRDAQREKLIDKNVEIRGVQFGAACKHDKDKAKYSNLKARMFGLLSEGLKAGLQLPPSPQGDVYLEELPGIQHKYDTKGRLCIEAKDDYKKRTGRKSPDDADSLALAYFGHYDEISVGSFARSGHAEINNRPMSGSLGERSLW